MALVVAQRRWRTYAATSPILARYSESFSSTIMSSYSDSYTANCQTAVNHLQAFLKTTCSGGARVEQIWTPATDPTNEQAWLSFCSWLLQKKNLKAATISSYLNGLRIFYMPQKIHPMFHNMAVLKLWTKGLRRRQKSTPSRKARVTEAHLLAAQQYCKTRPAEEANLLLLLFGTRGLCRLGELTTASSPRCEAITYDTDTATVKIKLPQSKTDVFRRGATVSATSPAIVRLIKRITKGRTPSAYIFSADGRKPIQRVSWIRWMRKACGLSAAYAGHSMRRGGAQMYVDGGMDMETLKRKGRWASDCYLVYICTKKIDEAAAAKAATGAVWR